MKLIWVTALMALSFCSCAVQNSTQSRISKNGAMYSKLSPQHRSLVASGEITQGMSKDAVYLAWGSPSKIYQLQEDGMSKERWLYMRSQPEPTTTVGIGYGGYPRYGRWGYNGGLAYGHPHRTYVSEMTAMAVFAKGKVERWEQKK